MSDNYALPLLIFFCKLTDVESMKSLKVKCLKTCERGKERCRRQLGFSWATKQLWKQRQTPKRQKSGLIMSIPSSDGAWLAAQMVSGHCWAHQPFRSYRVGKKTFRESQTKVFSVITDVVR